MGCVIFEVIVWLLYGGDEQSRFANTTKKAFPLGTPYWTVEGLTLRTAKVNEFASMWMKHILRNDPECNRDSGTAMGDLVRLVKEKLLVVELPPRTDEYTPGCRTNASDLLEELNRIVEKARGNSNYLFTNIDRTNIQAPPLGQESTTDSSHQQLLSPDAAFVQSNGPLSQNPSYFGKQLKSTRELMQNVYTHTLNDKWEYVNDNTFARSVLQRIGLNVSSLLPKTTSTLCQRCKSLDFDSSQFGFKNVMSELRLQSQCDFCKLLYQTGKKLGVSDTDLVEFDRIASGLRMNGQDPPVLQICQTSSKSARRNFTSNPY